ncbi:GIY-YIG nuclease family protein [Clostridium tyrobutyricum]|uniref:GIY-YIG nuclease family protein n=1 Tax=Clostridium tyrobutyricum TaxID=1519 RepID=UPI001C3817A6|nr:GIY-YIG nuclease family protein [Clostridium tyrobutyricum]MBV4427145.1 GIY-YIG nuclease family protein [Clostridium tyrobutyricum]MBV4442128.1 GIY-YIG nuclease family protein [Clostridium tyrobutyricum]MBV4442301.1 GIY-YIG nuclease family protein [Clostridium tyrobutyricum]
MIHKISGIYKITNLVNNKVYIGQSTDIKQRLCTHKSELKGGYHANYHLQRAWNQYGQSNFKFEILRECEEKLLDKMEVQWIRYYNSTNGNFGYNSDTGGHKNKHLSKEHKKKLSKSHKGKIVSNETKIKISMHSKGKKKTQEMREKLRQVNLGKHHSEATKKKLSKSHKGKTFSVEYKQKVQNMKIERVLNGNLQANNTSGITGVSFDKWANKWKSSIKLNGRSKYLGRFKKLEDAIKVRKEAEIKYFNKFNCKIGGDEE